VPHERGGEGIRFLPRLRIEPLDEHAQAIAAHASPRTTKLYDRRGEAITLDEVERIGT